MAVQETAYLHLPAASAAETYAPMADLAHATRLAAAHGVHFLSPDETPEFLSGYLSFCVEGG